MKSQSNIIAFMCTIASIASANMNNNIEDGAPGPIRKLGNLRSFKDKDTLPSPVTHPVFHEGDYYDDDDKSNLISENDFYNDDNNDDSDDETQVATKQDRKPAFQQKRQRTKWSEEEESSL